MYALSSGVARERASAPSRTEPAPHSSAAAAPPLESAPRFTPTRAGVGATESAASGPTEEPLITARLRAHAAKQLRTGWKKERADEIPEEELARGLVLWEESVLEGPVRIGADLARARTKAEAALADEARGGLFAVLAKLDAGGSAPLVDLVREPTRFDRLFARGRDGDELDGVEHRGHPDKALKDGGTLVFPPGVFLVSNLMREEDPFPRDVTIRGAGMDATLLVLAGNLSTRGELVNFTVQDCTVHTNGNYLFDLRFQPASVTFERVRFIGFDSGAGGSSLLFSTRPVAVRARDCRFEGGYGRASDGNLVDVRTDALLGRFDGCRFSRIHLRLDGIRPGAALYFVGSVFEEMLDRTHYDAVPRPGVVFANCTATYFFDTPGRDWNSVPRLDLNALFPSWESRIVR